VAVTRHIKFGDYLRVTDEGSGVIRVDGCPPGISMSAWVTVQTGAPSTFSTPFVFDDTPTTGGLYGWDGSAYQQIGGPL
jgi:hypothetical protein